MQRAVSSLQRATEAKGTGGEQEPTSTSEGRPRAKTAQPWGKQQRQHLQQHSNRAARNCARTWVPETPRGSHRGWLGNSFDGFAGRRRMKKATAKTAREVGPEMVIERDTCKVSRVGDAGDGEGAGSETIVTEETGSQSEMDVLKMKIRLRKLELEIAREQRGSEQSSCVEGGQ
ncbi:hypothetical protein HPB50_028796 [Hyalomma asiaticum]|nr:hypothetical protein HPB50_028796 [Hyalomma asiaticum]